MLEHLHFDIFALGEQNSCTCPGIRDIDPFLITDALMCHFAHPNGHAWTKNNLSRDFGLCYAKPQVTSPASSHQLHETDFILSWQACLAFTSIASADNDHPLPQ